MQTALDEKIVAPVSLIDFGTLVYDPSTTSWVASAGLPIHDSSKIDDPVSKNTSDVLTWNGSAWIASAPAAGGEGKIDDPVSKNTSDILTWDGSSWIASSPTASIPPPTSPDNYSFLVYDTNTTSWVASAGLPVHDPSKIDDPVSKNTSDVLTWNGSAWIAQAAAGGGITNPNTKNSGDVLVYDGTTWNAVTPTNIYNNYDLRGLDAYFDDVGVNTLSGDSIKCNSLSAIELSAVNIAANVTANISYYNSAGSGLQLSDAGSVVRLDYGTAGGIVVLSQSSVGWKPGTQIVLVQLGSFATTVYGGGGVTILSNNGLYTLNGQYALATLVYLGNDTWVLGGNLV